MRLGVSILIGFAALLSACGRGEQLSHSNERLKLARQDVAAILTMDPSGAEAVDKKFKGAFSAVFGGTKGSDVYKYYSARVHHLADPEKVRILPAKFSNENWLSPPADVKPSPASSLTALASEIDSKKFYEGARNIGIVYWLEGLVNQVPVFLTMETGNQLALESSRVGVVTLGEGYRVTQSDLSGREVRLPPEFRQTILLHEARHSDCTGGITESQLNLMRGARDTVEYDQRFKTMPCGHLHQICHGGDLDGLPACDNEAWGAYAVGAIYALAASQVAKTGEEKAILGNLYQDQIHRLQIDPAHLGKFGKPDMSHQGYVAEAK